MAINPDFWRGKRVLLTGHTGFKGSWLSLWLQSMGADLCGLALAPPTHPDLFTQAGVAQGMTSTLGDIRDYEVVRTTMASFKPEIVIHMAAQALVKRSYTEPIATYATNVMGTVHVLEAARHAGSVRAIVNVTTDKCYENKEWVWGYREEEPMGGPDPYSSSKGCSELITQAYRKSFFQDAGIALASARAGNVIGGGDWAADRLVPDTLRALAQHQPVVIRNPQAVRPWQHVLEPLSGYLSLAEKLFSEGPAWSEGWNFGPHDEDAKPVQWIVEALCQQWGTNTGWQLDQGQHPHEAHHLKLDISKAQSRLKWRPRWNLSTALNHIACWHKAWLDEADPKALCLAQIRQYNTPTPKASTSLP